MVRDDISSAATTRKAGNFMKQWRAAEDADEMRNLLRFSDFSTLFMLRDQLGR